MTAWSSVEATPVPGRDALHEACPGTGADAALKVHQVLSVGGGAPVRYHVSPARAHDRRHLPRAESWRGDGRRADLASASRARLRAGEAHGVRWVSRLPDHGQPQVHSFARGPGTQPCVPGAARDARLAEAPLVLEGRAMAAAVQVGGDPHTLPLGLVGVHPPTGDWCCRTHLPPRLGPRQVAALYRVRGEGERSRRVDQAVHRLDEVDSARPCALKTLGHAALLASTRAALLAPTHHLKTRPPQVGAPRPAAPLPPRRLAVPLAGSWQAIAHAFDLQGAAAQRRWDPIAALLTPSGQDPHWRRRPALLEQWRGWKRQPLARQKTNGGDVHHRNFNAAA